MDYEIIKSNLLLEITVQTINETILKTVYFHTYPFYNPAKFFNYDT